MGGRWKALKQSWACGQLLAPVPPPPAGGSVWLGLRAGWAPALPPSQALTHVFALVSQVETPLRARPGLGLCSEAGSVGLVPRHEAGSQGTLGSDRWKRVCQCVDSVVLSSCHFSAGKQAQGDRVRARLGWRSKQNLRIGTQDPLAPYLSASEAAWGVRTGGGSGLALCPYSGHHSLSFAGPQLPHLGLGMAFPGARDQLWEGSA